MKNFASVSKQNLDYNTKVMKKVFCYFLKHTSRYVHSIKLLNELKVSIIIIDESTTLSNRSTLLTQYGPSLFMASCHSKWLGDIRDIAVHLHQMGSIRRLRTVHPKLVEI